MYRDMPPLFRYVRPPIRIWHLALLFAVSAVALTWITGGFTQPITRDGNWPGRCPVCKSSEISMFVYGLVRPDRRMKRAIDDKIFILGGCVIRSKSPEWKCVSCGLEWGDYQANEPPRGQAGVSDCALQRPVRLGNCSESGSVTKTEAEWHASDSAGAFHDYLWHRRGISPFQTDLRFGGDIRVSPKGQTPAIYRPSCRTSCSGGTSAVPLTRWVAGN